MYTWIKKRLNVDIGFSGHGLGLAGSIGAIALGSNVIEKHVTINRKMSGPDRGLLNSKPTKI